MKAKAEAAQKKAEEDAQPKKQQDGEEEKQVDVAAIEVEDDFDVDDI